MDQMITLVMTLCVTASPTDCREVKRQFMQTGLTVYVCSMKAQMIIANPMDPLTRPGEHVSKYRCRKSFGLFAKI